MDEHLRKLERLARTGDLPAQEKLERWRRRLYPQCECPQERLLDTGCKCGYGPVRPIFDLETVLGKADGWRIYPRPNGFEAWGTWWYMLADPSQHLLRIARADHFDRWSINSLIDADFPYTWEDWEAILQQMRDLGYQDDPPDPLLERLGSNGSKDSSTRA